MTLKQIDIPGVPAVSWGSTGYSLNDAGEVLGSYTVDFSGTSAIFYYHAGQAVVLNSSLIANPPAGLRVFVAYFIDRSSSQILLCAYLPTDNLQHWYLLTPVSSDTATTPAVSGVVNAASFASRVSSGSWISVEGANLSATTRSWGASDFVDGSLPTKLDGVQVTVNGIPAYPSYISPTQINVLTPDDATTGDVQVQVSNAQGTSKVFTVTGTSFAPAFFLASSKYPAATHASGILVGPVGLVAGATFVPAAPGETIVVYGTGFGSANPNPPAGQILKAAATLANPVTITIGGMQATVAYAGLASNGLDQLNVIVPADLGSVKK